MSKVVGNIKIKGDSFIGTIIKPLGHFVICVDFTLKIFDSVHPFKELLTFELQDFPDFRMNYRHSYAIVPRFIIPLYMLEDEKKKTIQLVIMSDFNFDELKFSIYEGVRSCKMHSYTVVYDKIKNTYSLSKSVILDETANTCMIVAAVSDMSFAFGGYENLGIVEMSYKSVVISERPKKMNEVKVRFREIKNVTLLDVPKDVLFCDIVSVSKNEFVAIDKIGVIRFVNLKKKKLNLKKIIKTGIQFESSRRCVVFRSNLFCVCDVKKEQIQVLNKNSKQNEGLFSHKKCVFLSSVSSNGILASVSDKKVILWDIFSNKKLSEFNPFESGVGILISLSLQNGVFACVSDDGLMKIYDVGSTTVGEEKEVEKLEKDDRFEYCVGNEKVCDLNIVLNNKTIQCFKSIVLYHAEKNKLTAKSNEEGVSEIIIKKSFDVSNEIILEMFLGREFFIREEEYIEYYMFFKELNLEKMLKAVVLMVKEINDVSSIIEIFFQAHERLEENDLFFIAIMSLLRSKYKVLKKNSKFMERMKKIQMVEKLQEFKIPSSFHSNNISHLVNFVKMHELCMKEMFNNKLYCNTVLKTKDGGKFFVQKEILFYESNFFYLMFKSPFLESCSPVIEIQYLSSNELKCFLQYLYFKYIETSDLSLYLRLYNHFRMYFEDEFLNYLIDEIKIKLKGLIKKKRWKKEIIKCGYLIENCSELINLISKIIVEKTSTSMKEVESAFEKSFINVKKIIN